MHVDYSVPGVEEQFKFICTEAVGMGEYGTEVLRLTKRTENKDQTNCVAVWYCWSAQREETPESGGKVYVVTTPGGSTRDPRCPQAVLHRAVQYSRRKGIPFI